MNKQHKLIKAIYIAIIATMLPLSSVQAEANINWILSGTSPSLDRSTKFLSNGYTDAGIRYAKKALARSNKTLVEELIAQHNLCIAYTREGDTQNAATHCQQARALPKPQVGLKQVKEGLYKVKKRGKASEMFQNLITQNLMSINSEQIARIEQTTDMSKTN